MMFSDWVIQGVLFDHFLVFSLQHPIAGIFVLWNSA